MLMLKDVAYIVKSGDYVWVETHWTALYVNAKNVT